MSDDATGEDGLTQRERRAQRHRGNRAKQAPTDWARKGRVALPFLVIAAIVIAGAGLIVYLKSTGAECPDHWHATQAVFVPGGAKQGEYDTFHRIDWNSPIAPNGRPFYNFNTAPAMSMTIHMHQDGPERGEAAHGPSQFHFEGGTKCIGIQNALHIIHLEVDADSVQIAPDSPLAAANAAYVGPYVNDGNQTLHFFLQTEQDSGQWEWSERNFGEYLHYQLKDGESMLLAFGHYSPEQIEAMKQVIPRPSGSPQPEATVIIPGTSTNTTASATTPSTTPTSG